MLEEFLRFLLSSYYLLAILWSNCYSTLEATAVSPAVVTSGKTCVFLCKSRICDCEQKEWINHTS